MNKNGFFYTKNREILGLYWELVKIILPIAIATQVLVEFGVIDALAPTVAPAMALYGLPPELAFAWLTGLLVGVWGAIVVLFTVVPVSELSVAQMTIFSSLLLFAHGLPIEQRIIQKAGPGFIVTSVLRVAGGMIYAMILYAIFKYFDLFTARIDPAWIPTADSSGWAGFVFGTIESLIWMLVILVSLAWFLEFLKWSGAMNLLKRIIKPIFILAGIKEEASQMVAVGLLLGVSYGGALLIREARNQTISHRQIFLSCVFMGFAHGIIEDTIVVIALGADFTSVFAGRIVFSILATAAIALVLRIISEKRFLAFFFNVKNLQGST